MVSWAKTKIECVIKSNQLGIPEDYVQIHNSRSFQSNLTCDNNFTIAFNSKWIDAHLIRKIVLKRLERKVEKKQKIENGLKWHKNDEDCELNSF